MVEGVTTAGAGVFSPGGYRALYRASASDRIAIIRDGVQAVQAKRLFADLAIAQGMGFSAFQLSGATVNKKAKLNQQLSIAEGERILGCARLIGQLEAMIEESGNGDGFDAAGWLSRWLQTPLPALADRRPLDLMDTMEGQGLVSATLAKLQTGAYA